MQFRNWLLMGTSLTLMALAPIPAAYAQDATAPDLVAAYQAYQADQSDDNKQALTEACIAAGFQSLDDCIAALAASAPVEQATPSEEPAPVAEPSSEEPAPVEQAAPSEEPAPVEAAPSEEPAPVEQAAPSEEPAPVEQAAPVAEPSSEEMAPAPSSEEQMSPAPSSEAAPATSEEPAADPLVQLTAAVELYNQGVADLTAGDAGGQAKIDQANGQITQICGDAGFADTTACLTQFGLTLNPLPAQPGEPTMSSETPVAPSSEPMAPETPISEMPNASEEVTPSAVEVLPPEVKPEEAAPILDSAKDDQNSNAEGQPSSEPEAQPSQEPVAPPKDDKQAQVDITPPPADVQSTQTDKGKKTDRRDVHATPPTDNKDIKIIDQPKKDNGKPDTGLIFQIGINLYINDPHSDRDRFYDPKEDEIYYEDLSRGRTRETIVRADGSKVVTVRNRNGDVLQRSKITPKGREIILSSYDPDDQDLDNWRDPGQDLPPLRLNIPARDYILDADDADEDQVQLFLDQPPVEQVRRIYTIDEVKRSARLRDSVRRLEVGGLTFDSGKATISRDQVGALSKVAKAMQTLLDRDPAEVFLIEGHTDAVGSDVANLVLSDQRAATVARILSDFYDIPPENLVTQGYGERYLKVKTELAEPLNRRVTVKRITPLISYAAAN